MNGRFEKTQSRRDIFKSFLRYSALGVLGILMGNIFAKKRRLAQNGICINRQICRSCRIFDECGLPPALSLRANVQENG